MTETVQSKSDHFVTIKKIDEDRQMVFGEVYAPYVIDTYGDMMLPEDIETMCHRYMKELKLPETIDTNHDEKSNGSYPIESFIARAGDPDYTEGAWVLGVKVVEKTVWAEVKKGNINGFSFQALVRKVSALVDIEVMPDNLVLTEESEGHTHIAYVKIGDDGRVVYGRTSTDDDHDHMIEAGTATEPGKSSSGVTHRHRFFVE